MSCMKGFVSGEPQGPRVWRAGCCAAFLACCAALLCGGCGCRKGPPEVYTDRANDTAYIDSLIANSRQQREAAQARHETSILMTQCVQRVRATLPPDTGEEALVAALADDPAWQGLAAQAEAQDAAAARIYEEGLTAVRNRILEEKQALSDVQVGKAKAADKPRVGHANGRP